MDIQHIGANFRVVKPLAILIVITSHYWAGLWWVPTTISLFLFGFSSGYFTGVKYTHRVALRPFWRSKFYRLVPRLLVINLFLTGLFLFQGKEGIFSLHTIPNLLGLSGFLNWFHIQNQSPFGMGLWFFTILLLFYLIYPILALIKKNQFIEQTALIVFLIGFSWLQFNVEYGYQIWPTALSFILGVYFAHRIIRFSPVLLTLLGGAIFTLMVVFNVILHETHYNYYLILAFSITAALFLLQFPLPAVIVKCFTWLDSVVLEVYFIHQYLFLHSDRLSPMSDFFLSVIIIIPVSLILRKISQILEQKFLTDKKKEQVAMKKNYKPA